MRAYPILSVPANIFSGVLLIGMGGGGAAWAGWWRFLWCYSMVGRSGSFSANILNGKPKKNQQKSYIIHRYPLYRGWGFLYEDGQDFQKLKMLISVQISPNWRLLKKIPKETPSYSS
jgi:hypothetical protein